jgi:hypothetical protein
VTLDEPCDRGVVGLVLRGDDPGSDVLLARALDRSRGPHPARIGVEHQGHHHRRLVGRATMAILAIGAIERRQIHRADRVDHKPRQIAFPQPLPDVGRHQEHLLASTRQEVLRHP